MCTRSTTPPAPSFPKPWTASAMRAPASSPRRRTARHQHRARRVLPGRGRRRIRHRERHSRRRTRGCAEPDAHRRGQARRRGRPFRKAQRAVHAGDQPARRSRSARCTRTRPSSCASPMTSSARAGATSTRTPNTWKPGWSTRQPLSPLPALRQRPVRRRPRRRRVAGQPHLPTPGSPPLSTIPVAPDRNRICSVLRRPSTRVQPNAV